MSTIQLVEFDVRRFPVLVYAVPEPSLEMYMFDGRPRTEWVELPVEVEGRTTAYPDIWRLSGAAGLVMGASATQALEPWLSHVAELLPLVFGGVRLWFVNILRVVDCLDYDSSMIAVGTQSLCFVEDRLPESGLFKVPDLSTSHIFTCDVGGGGFAEQCRAQGLEGLVFSDVWTSHEGPIELPSTFA